ncbi:MAG: TIR domain-containing protein [Chloroflexota bacterium]
MSRVEKTVFISYRRTNIYHARAIHNWLTSNGCDAFLDYENIDNGAFERIILREIDARAHFLLVLTPSALERCANPDDWLRREIERAMDLKRNIVPLLMDNFTFSDAADYLTGKLRTLPEYNGIEVPQAYFNEAMQRLVDRFLATPLDMVLHPTPVENAAAVAATIASVSAQPLPTDAELSAERHYEKGKALYFSGQIKQALGALDEAIRLKPDMAAAYTLRCRARRNQSQRGPAIDDLERAVELTPDGEEKLRLLAWLESERGSFDRALDYARQALASGHDRFESLHVLAGVYELMKDPAAQQDVLREMVAINPDFAPSHYNLGRSLVLSDQAQAALPHLDRTLALNPSFAQGFTMRGIAYIQLNQPLPARADFNEAIRLDPAEASAYAYRGWLTHMTNTDMAIADYERALEIDPHHAQAQEFLAGARRLKATKDIVSGGLKWLFGGGKKQP